MATSSKKTTAPGSENFGLPTMDDLLKQFEKFKLPGVDVNALVEWQRKDMEALSQATREAQEGIRALVERRNQILQEMAAQWQENMRESMSADALSKRSEAFNTRMQKAMENIRELATMEADTRNRAWKVLQDRMQENMANLQKLMQPKK